MEIHWEAVIFESAVIGASPIPNSKFRSHFRSDLLQLIIERSQVRVLLLTMKPSGGVNVAQLVRALKFVWLIIGDLSFKCESSLITKFSL